MNIQDGKMITRIIKYIGTFLLLAILTLFLTSSAWALSGTKDDAGTNYYIASAGNGGSNSNDGLSGDDEGGGVGPWLTLAKPKAATVDAAGADVFLLCGDTWTAEQVSIDYAGVNGDNYAIIGAYYMDGATETIGVSGNKPIIRGAATIPDEDSDWPDFDGLVEAESKRDYVWVENLNIKNSGGYGVHLDDGPISPTVKYCDFESIWDHSIWVDESTNAVIEYNTFVDTAREYLNLDGNWPQAISCGREYKASTGALIRFNTSNGGYGEAITPGDNSVTMFNLLINHRVKTIYLDAVQGAEVAYNLIFGTDETTYRYVTSPDYHAQGISLNIEPGLSAHCSDHKIHHNIVINMHSGLSVMNTRYSVDTNYHVKDNEFYNNTFIDCKYNVILYNSNGGINFTNYYKNNLSYDNHADSVCVAIVAPNPTNWVADYNAWYPSYNEGDDALSGGNDVTGDPGFSKATWRGTTTLNDKSFTISDLALGSGSDEIDAGATLNQAFDDGFNAASAKPPSTITTSDQDDNGDPPGNWEIGAVVYTGAEDPPAPTVTITTTTPLTCPYGQDPIDVTFSGTSDVNAYYRISTTNQTWDQMTSSKAVQNGNGTQSYSHIISLACGQTISYWIAGSTEAGDNGAESATQEDEVVIGSEQGQNPPAAVTLYNDGSGDIAITLYNDSSGAIGVTLQ